MVPPPPNRRRERVWVMFAVAIWTLALSHIERKTEVFTAIAKYVCRWCQSNRQRWWILLISHAHAIVNGLLVVFRFRGNDSM